MFQSVNLYKNIVIFISVYNQLWFELNKIIYLLLVLFIGCGTLRDKNSVKKIQVSASAKNRVDQLINDRVVENAELYNLSDPAALLKKKFVIKTVVF